MNDNRRIAILLSGRGSNFLAIHDAIESRDLDAEICCVISNVETAPGLARARELGLVSLWVSSRGMDRAEYDRLLLANLRPYQPALVCLAGFMRILGAEFLKEYQGRVLNIHPSLLPSFPGLHAQRQALEHGVGITGCTVHVVDEGVDSGPILIQRAVQVREGDTEDSLSSRILEQEHSIYWRAIALVLDRNSVNGVR
jgi:phosphoribosylglycinamide formyltransferase 1